MSEAKKSYEDMSESEKKKEDWMNNKWRPMMGWMYMVVCMCDFVVFPILWSLIQVHGGGEVKAQWMPITLQGAGLFHIAMGAILGIAAYGRTQEKMAGANNGGINNGFGTTGFGSGTPSFGPSQGFNTPGRNFNQPSNGFNSAPKINNPSMGRSSSGRAMPTQDDDPVL
jgi:hypothetical protein